MNLRTAEPRVQLIGYTKYIPPTDEDHELVLPMHEGALPGEALIEFAGRSCYESYTRPNERTATMPGYMANILEVGHFSILEHASISVYVTGLSRTCTHELVRHRHLSPSQLSQRFVDGSVVNYVLPPVLRDDEEVEEIFAEVQDVLDGAYEQISEKLVAKGVQGKKAKEAARAVLPNATEARIVLTGNYRAWLEFLTKRDSEHADAEIRDVAQMIGAILEHHAPNVFGSRAREIWKKED